MPRLILTEHARKRMAQRNVSMAQICFIVEYGQQTHCAGAIFVTLRRKDIPASLRPQNEFGRLEGTTVVLSRREPVIMTVWRNRRRGLPYIRRKPRHCC